MACQQHAPSEETSNWASTFVIELNDRFSRTNGLEQFRLNANCIESNSMANNDLILDLTAQENINKVALEYFKELRGNVTTAALQLACRYNWKEVVDYLLKRVPIHVRSPIRTGDDPLIIAASFNFTSLVKTLVERGADITEKDVSGKNALHLAAQHGNRELCEYLLGKPNIDVNDKDYGEKTPLHLAMLSGERGKKAASFLITKGADIIWEDQGKRSALEIAAGEGDDKIIKILIDSVPEKDKTLLKEKMDEALFIAAGAGYEKVVTILVDQGADVNYINEETEGKLTVLHVAAINGHLSITNILLSKNADEKLVDSRNMTPFHRACQNGHLEIAKLDVWKNALHLNRVDKEGNTPIMLAISRGRDDVVSYLIDLHIKLGVELDIVDNKGFNIIHKAVDGAQPETLKLILARKDLPILNSLVNGKDSEYQRTPLHYAAMTTCNEELVHLLIRNGAYVLQDKKGKTPVHIAARYGHINCIHLLEQTESGNIDEVDGKGRHIVHQAAKSRQPSLILCHSKPKDLILKDKNGWTPLHYAAQEDGIETIKIIIKTFSKPKGGTTLTVADVINQVNNNNETALHIACREEHIECINLLLDNGADVSIKTTQGNNEIGVGGKTCLDEAVIRGKENITELLLNHKTTLDILWRDRKFICDINILIQCYPYSNAAKLLLDKCCIEENGKKKYLFGMLDKVEDNTDRTPERYFAPSTMDAEEKDDLVTHEVTVQLILHKWNGFGRWLYLTWALINGLFTALLTSLIIDMKGRGFTSHNHTVNRTLCMVARSPEARVIPILLLPIGFTYFIAQVVFMFYLRTRYLNFNNLFRFLITVFTFLFILPYVACHVNSFREILKGKKDYQLQFGSIAVLLSWVNMMFYFRHFFYGIYVIMLTEVLKSWLKSIVVFAILIIAFALSFYCVLDELKQFKLPGYAVVKTLVWFIGEISYEDIFINEHLRYKPIATLLLIIFFITMNVAFINLLVGVAVGDINAVRKKASVILLKEKINAIEVLYNVLPASVRKYLHRSKYTPKDGLFFRLTNRFGNVMVNDLLQKDQNQKREFRRMAMRVTQLESWSSKGLHTRRSRFNENI